MYVVDGGLIQLLRVCVLVDLLLGPCKKRGGAARLQTNEQQPARVVWAGYFFVCVHVCLPPVNEKERYL